ncbi:MAG: ubiquinone anaerobic biosynthesis accessory factor UbiT [Vibrionaceae bacterium]
MFLDKLRGTLVENAAFFFQIPAKLTPAPMRNLLVKSALQQALAQQIVQGELDFLLGRTLEVRVNDLDFCTFISLQERTLLVTHAQETQADVRFSGCLNDLLLLAARKEDPDTLFFQRRLLIEGDTALGLQVKNALDSVDLSALPPFVQMGLSSLGDFVAQGLQQRAQTAAL